MGLKIGASGDTGMSLYATLQQVTANGALGDYWNVTAAAWAAAPPLVDREVTLTEGSSTNVGSYAGGTGTLGTVTGFVRVRIHDRNLANQVIGVSDRSIVAGDEQVNVTVDIPAIATAVRGELNSNPVPSSNMRGTDNALLAATYVAPLNATITTGAADSLAAKNNALAALSEATLAKTFAASADAKLPADTATKLATSATQSTASAASALNVETRLTSVRAGYIDNLSAGPVATQAQVSAIQNTTRSKFVAPAEVQIPSSGSVQVLITLILFDTNGDLNDADATPVFTAKNSAAVSRTANLSAVTHPSVGVYEVFYTVASTHLSELINVQANWNESAVASLDIVSMNVTALISGGGFTSTDRTQLVTMYNKLPSRLYLAGTDAPDGDLNLDNFSGDRTTFMADVSALATSAELAGVESHGDLTWATAAGFLTSTDIRLNNLDATISSRSDFEHTTDTVTLAPGQGIALEATSQAILAKTNLIPPNPAEDESIPTVSEIAVGVDQVITAAHGAGPYITLGGDATLAMQNQILAQIAAMTPTPVSPIDVSDSRTWELTNTGEGATAQNIVTMSTTESVTLAVNFENELNPQASITSVVSVTVTDGDPLVTTNLAPDGRRTHAHFMVSGATAGYRRLEVLVTTSDGQASVGKVTLEVV